MDNTRLTIACEADEFGGYDINVTFERDSRIKFREAFISLDRPMLPYLIEESDINGENAVKSATTAMLSHIIGVINKSLKTDSHIFSDKEIDSMFEFKELYAIKRFSEIAGVKFDESKFKNREEFQEYFAKWLDSQLK